MDSFKKEKIVNLERKIIAISSKYGRKIVYLVNEETNLTHGKLCEKLDLSVSGLNAIMNKMIAQGIIIKEQKGKNVFYSLTNEVRSLILLAQKEQIQTQLNRSFKNEKIVNLERKINAISSKYGRKIVYLVNEETNLTHGKLCEKLDISASGLNAIMKKMIVQGIIVKEQKGKNVFYSLTNEVQSLIFLDQKEQIQTQLNRSFQMKKDTFKVIYINMLQNCVEHPYATYLLKDIDFTMSYFSVSELIMLLFISGIYTYSEIGSFTSLFHISEKTAISTQKYLTNKFKNFLFEVVQLDNENSIKKL